MNAEATDAIDTPAPPVDWKPLAAAYNLHHFNCHSCRAAGRGMGYGQRCEAGAELWTAYQTAAMPQER